MTNKEAIANFKKILFGEDKVTEKFEEVSLSDDSKIQVEPTIEVGAVVSVVDSEGVVTPLPDETYELSDKRKIIVKDGKIESIDDVQEEAEEMGETVTQEEVNKMIQAIESMFKSELESVKSDFSAYKKEVKENNAKVNKALFETLETFGKEPNETPPEKKGGVQTKRKNAFH